MRRARWVIAGLLWGSGCGPSDVYLPLPPDVRAQDTLILGLQRAGEPLEVRVVRGDARPLLTVDIDASDALQITALRYLDGPEALGLSLGTLGSVEPAACGARPLPATTDVHQAVVQSGQVEGWAAPSQWPASLEAFRFAGPCPCHRFEVVATTPISALPEAGVTRPDGTAWLLDELGGVSLLDRDGRIEPVSSRRPGPPPDPRAAHLDDEGQLWVATHTSLWRGTPEAGFVSTATLGETLELEAIGGGRGPAGYELFGSADGGEVLQLAPGRPRLVSRRAEGPADAEQGPNVVWRGPGRALVSEEGTLEIVRIEGGEVRGRISLPAETRGAGLLVDLGADGVLAISRLSPVFLIEGAGARELVEAPEVARPLSAVPFEGGVLYTGDAGYLQEYRPDFGFCPTQLVETLGRFHQLYSLGDRLALLGPAIQTSGYTLTLVEPRPLRPGG